MLNHSGRDSLLPDTHAHLDAPAFAADLREVLTRAEQVGVERVLAVGSDLASSRQAISIAQRFPCVYAAVGVHPQEASRFREEAEEVEALLEEDKVVAIGEIGLEYHRGGADREVQLEAFREQARWAGKRDMTISLHNRGADTAVLEVLATTGARAVLHCFSGGWEFASKALDAGHCLSFAGNLTYPKAGPLRAVAERVPLDRVLLETDCPVLAPQAHRGRRNEPAYLCDTLATFAAGRKLEPGAAAQHLSANAERLFHWSEA